MRRLALLCLAALLTVCGCEQTPPQPKVTIAEPAPVSQPAAPATNSAATGLFNQPQQPLLVELLNHAIPSWRTEAQPPPALVLFSYDPFLKPIDSSLTAAALQLARSGNTAELIQHGSINTAEPLILPNQALTAAIDAGLFSKFYWIFPSKVPPQQLDLEYFRSQMREQLFMTDAEVDGLSLTDGVFTGSLRGIPFSAVHYQRLQKITEPLLLHIDMSFFRGLYDNEIKSPLYQLIRQTALSIGQLNLEPLVTSLSYSTLEGANSMDVRFMISNLADLIKNPALLDAEMPADWQIRNDALYAGDMYSEAKKMQLSLQITQLAPDSAAAHYDRFQALFLDKQSDEALLALQRAVALDPGYGAAYIQLAQLAVTDNNLPKAIELLGLAEPLFPENPVISLQKADLLAFSGEVAAARASLARLPQNWSPQYHASIPKAIGDLRRQLDTAAEKEEPREQ